MLEKCPTGIQGFDDITGGGLPRGRTTLLCGGPGCGKTLFGTEFLVNGITRFRENGVFITFEETPEDLTKNVASLGFDLDGLIEADKLAVDHVRVERSEIAETGEYNLDGLFLRLELAISSVGAKRVVIDTLEMLFGGLSDYGILRSELRRLFFWLKERGVTAVVTAERGEGQLTRHGLEEYVSDCVVLLDHRVTQQVSTRRIRVVKYRGSSHATDEFPFLIDKSGISVWPITAYGLDHQVSKDRVSTGVAELDEMLGGGYYRASTILVSGTAGAGKSSLGAHFVDAACRRGERCVYFSFEESPRQIKRNMSSIGLGLGAHEKKGLLEFVASRATSHGLETHLAIMFDVVRKLAPQAVVIDPVSNLMGAASQAEAKLMVVRLIDYLKSNGITAVMTNLTRGGASMEATEISISSLVDTWLLVRILEDNGERNRGLYVLKSRGMAHSNQIREFVMTPRGIVLIDAYLGPSGIVTGTARVQQEIRERAERAQRQQALARRRAELDRKRASLTHQIAELRGSLEAEEEELARMVAEEEAAEIRRGRERAVVRRQGQGEAATSRGRRSA